MTDVRPPAVAGRFYPADGDELRRTVGALLEEAEPPGAPVRGRAPPALALPHAGYRFSGSVAATGYRLLADAVAEGAPLERVLLLGPAHTVSLRGVAVATHRAFRTPLGDVALDGEARDVALRNDTVEAADRPHRAEHGLEVHLPFLQVAAPSARIVPLVVGETPTAEVAELLGALTDAAGSDPGTLVVVSTDLSHYLSYDEARRVDRETADAVEALDPDALTPERACGCYALRGLLAWARGRNYGARTLDLRSSGDTAGPRDRVVGYGAFVLGGELGGVRSAGSPS